MPGQVLLNIEVPLLDVGPNGLTRDGAHRKWEERNNSAGAANTGITGLPGGATTDSAGDVELGSIERKRGRAFQ